MEQVFKHSMIPVTADQGFSAEIMEAAKETGVTSGMAVYTTGSELGNPETFFEMALKPERELILVLTQQSLWKGITQVVMKTHGSGADVDAFVFSLPVGQVIGLTSQENHKGCNA